MRLANGVHLRFSDVYLDRFSTSGVVTRAPGFDLIADTPPGPPAYVETVGAAFMQVRAQGHTSDRGWGRMGTMGICGDVAAPQLRVQFRSAVGWGEGTKHGLAYRGWQGR